MKRLALRTDMERRSFFLMKWAERFEICAGSFQWKIRANHFGDVVRRSDLLYCLGRNHSLLFFARLLSEAMSKSTQCGGAFQTMKKLSILVLIAVLATLETGQAREVIHKGDVVVVPLRGEISPSLLMFLRRTEKVAESSGASAIIFEMNTYGGRLDSAEEITSALNHATIPTYTFINSNAGSAGSLIALATQHIYMAPVSAIGAAAPVMPTG